MQAEITTELNRLSLKAAQERMQWIAQTLTQALHCTLQERGCPEATELVEAKPVFESLPQFLSWVQGNLARTERLLRHSPGEEQVIRRIKEYIELNIHQELTRENIAAAVYLNPDYTARLFKRKTGQSLNDYIQNKRINLARQLLAGTDMPWAIWLSHWDIPAFRISPNCSNPLKESHPAITASNMPECRDEMASEGPTGRRTTMDVWTHAVGRMPYRFNRFPRTKEHCLDGVWDFALISRAEADMQTPEQLGALPKPKAISVPDAGSCRVSISPNTSTLAMPSGRCEQAGAAFYSGRTGDGWHLPERFDSGSSYRAPPDDPIHRRFFLCCNCFFEWADSLLCGKRAHCL